MSSRLLAALALLSVLTAFAPAPEASTSPEMIASADDKCVWVTPTQRFCY